MNDATARNWVTLSAPSLADLEVMATAAFARLPDSFRALCEGVVFHVDDYPSEEVQKEMDAGELDLMGLFQGVGLPHRMEHSGQMPNMVWLYRVPILLY